MPSTSKPRNRKAQRRILLARAEVATAPSPPTIPTRWLNNVIALFLIPPAWVLTQAFFTSFRRATYQHAFWATEEFWFFSLGAIVWALAFCGSIWVFGEPRPLRVYVFGHELTHALWARAMGGRIFKFRASRTGGFVLTDKANFWIALAPYFHPLYSIFIIGTYGALSLFYDLRPYTPLLFALLGLTWSFHFSFTLWMIPKGQTDLSSYGTFFSLVVIYTLNLLQVCALLVFAAPEISFAGFGAELVHFASEFADAAMRLFNTALQYLVSGLAG